MKITYFFFSAMLSSTLLFSFPNQKNVLVLLQPLEFVHVNRFDVMAKYLYARHREFGVQKIWAEEVYREHLAVWNNFFENIPAYSFPLAHGIKMIQQKHTFKDFLDSFNKLLDDIKINGFKKEVSIVPVDSHSVLIDGGHRAAAALCYNKPVMCQMFFNVQGYCATAEFFKNRTTYVKTGLRTEYLDAMALEYIKLKKNSYLFIIFPPALKEIEKVKTIISKKCTIIYQKQVALNETGARNLLYLCYKNEPWIGSYHDNFGGLQVKKNQCFPHGSGAIELFAVESSDLAVIKETKKEIRALFNCGNSSVHSEDFYEQTVHLTQTLFNNNGIHWLQYAQLKNFQHFREFIDEYKNALKKNNVDSEQCCIDSGGVLAVYGLRDCADLDLIHFNDISAIESAHIHSHHSELPYHAVGKNALIFNPAHYFYIDGCKFISLEMVKKMKEKRAEEKDKRDIELIKQAAYN